MKILDIKKSALLLVEYQDEWLGKDSKLSFLMKDKEQFEKAKINSKILLDYARRLNMNIIHIPFTVSSDYKEFGREKAHFGLRAIIQEVKTWQGNSKNFHKDFTPQENEFIVKGRVGASGFSGSNLDVILKNNGISKLYIIGFATNVCVESTLRDAHDKGYDSLVISDGTSSFTYEEKQFFLKNIIHHYGKSLTTKEFLNKEVKIIPHEIVLDYYKALGSGDIEKALTFVSEDIEYIAVKEHSETNNELYGKYKGKEALKSFFNHLHEFYITENFTLDSFASNDNEAFIKGSLRYKIKKNNAIYKTHWMAHVKIMNAKIIYYQFFKDTALLENKYNSSID